MSGYFFASVLCNRFAPKWKRAAALRNRLFSKKPGRARNEAAGLRLELFASSRNDGYNRTGRRFQFEGFHVAFRIAGPISFPVRYMLRNWITVLLLCSFLRLQFVCCCGAVGHCDSTNEPISDVQTDKQHSKASCSNSHHKRESSNPKRRQRSTHVVADIQKAAHHGNRSR